MDADKALNTAIPVGLASLISITSASAVLLLLIGGPGGLLALPIAPILAAAFWPPALAASILWVTLVRRFARRINEGRADPWKAWPFSILLAAVVGFLIGGATGLVVVEPWQTVLGLGALSAIGGVSAAFCLTGFLYQEALRPGGQ